LLAFKKYSLKNVPAHMKAVLKNSQHRPQISALVSMQCAANLGDLHVPYLAPIPTLSEKNISRWILVHLA
jgi:hypothetical protein